MSISVARSNRRWCATVGKLAVAALGVLGAAPAHAHFVLEQPLCYSMQDSLGSPQKSAPCGQADPGMTVQPTGMVTTYTQGQKITLKINETVFHPGHYRLSIAQNQAGLPADPPVTAGATACGSTTITANPTLPIVADGLFLHTAAFSGSQSVEVTLPPNFTCTNCTLQLSEFMSDHGLNPVGGCFYHHCATVSILPAADGGTSTPDAAVSQPPPGGGCKVGAAAAPTAASAAGLLALSLLLLRRRPRALGR